MQTYVCPTGGDRANCRALWGGDGILVHTDDGEASLVRTL